MERHRVLTKNVHETGGYVDNMLNFVTTLCIYLFYSISFPLPSLQAGLWTASSNQYTTDNTMQLKSLTVQLIL